MTPFSESEIEAYFSTDLNRSKFAPFCSSIIALEAPHTSSFPILTTKGGSDGGIDGEWEIEDGNGFVPVAIATVGWNVYQFKTVDIQTLGAKKAFTTLCQSVAGAARILLARLKEPKDLKKYVLFTNLRLGPETETFTKKGATLNSRRKKIRDAILQGGPKIDVTIIDAAQLASFLIHHPPLRIGWFSEGYGTTWDEWYERELRISGREESLVGRDAEVADVQKWLLDPDVRVIAVSGPNSVGKTRLTIEATRAIRSLTFLVDDVHALVKDGVASFATTQRPVIIVVDDPPIDVAKRLSEQAVGCVRPIKLLITTPSSEQTPKIRLGDDTAEKSCNVQRLSKEAAGILVDSVRSGLDARLRDWIISQSGGIPGILIAAARDGLTLHRDSESLRKQLCLRFKQRLSIKAQVNGLSVLQALSPLSYVHLASSSLELTILLHTISPEVPAALARKTIQDLVAFGFIRKQGEFVTVVPPMFAAGLFSEALTADSDLLVTLLANLPLSGRKKTLERLATLEISDATGLGQRVFGVSGPFHTPALFIENIELLVYCARALPHATTRFLLQQMTEMWTVVFQRGQFGIQHLLATLNELIDESETADAAFSILTELATLEALESSGTHVADAFAECYVYWFPRSVPYSKREYAITSMLASTDVRLRSLGLKAVVIATTPPDSLSGRIVTTRRIGNKPRYEPLNVGWDFLLRMIQIRIELCNDADETIRSVALAKLPLIISQVAVHLPAIQAMSVVRQITNLFAASELPLDATELRDNIRYLQDHFQRSSLKDEQKKWATEWQAVIDELEATIKNVESGPFDHRLKLAISRTSDYDEIFFEGRTIYEYQVGILLLAREACAKPEVVSDQTWDVLADEGSINRHDFTTFLGECDSSHHFYPSLLKRASSTLPWPRLLAAYLFAAERFFPAWYHDTVQELVDLPETPKYAVLITLVASSPTVTSRLQLQKLIRNRVVTPDQVANVFSVGRWLENVPVEEVQRIFEFILSEPNHESHLLSVTSLYIHHQKPLPRELFDVVKRALTVPIHSYSRDPYHYDQVASGLARGDLSEGLKFLEECILRCSTANGLTWIRTWNPFDQFGTHDFWNYLRSKTPRQAYSTLGGWNLAMPTPERSRDRSDRHLLDLTAHLDVLIDLARSNRNAARVFASCAASSQPEFFTFAYRLVEVYPDDELVLSSLSGALVRNSGWGERYQWFDEAIQIVQAEIKHPPESASARTWLESLLTNLSSQRDEAYQRQSSVEPFGID